jgi:hypothetical protein
MERTSDTSKVVLESSGQDKSTEIKTSKVTLLIREESSPTLTVEQLSAILTAVRQLNDAIAKIYQFENNAFVVGSIESGSDKSIDLIGAAGAAAKLKELILESWDRIRYSKPMKLSANLKALEME